MSEQQIAWKISLVLMIMVACGFIFVAVNAGKRTQDYAMVQKSGYSFRNKLFGVLVLTLGFALIYTLRTLPYGATHSDVAGPVSQVVDVKGYQWRWELSSNHIVVDQPVEFRVTSADVNHGFAIYDTGMHIIAQTQAMPGYINKLRYTFSKKGTYKVMCLEYCGIAHHNMVTEFNVVER